jgi:uncharacterized damage-inducible protein DinB
MSMYQRLVTLAVVLSAFGAETLSKAERDYAIQTLQESRKQFLDTVAGLSDRQWNFKPGPDRWSIGEIAEHLALTEDRLFHDALDSLKRSDPDPGSRKPTDEAVMRFMTDRTIKAQAPAYLQPAHTADKKALVSRFTASRDRTITYIQRTTDDLRHHYTLGPLGPMDAYQTIIGMSGHCQKHVGQMRDVENSPMFPK